MILFFSLTSFQCDERYFQIKRNLTSWNVILDGSRLEVNTKGGESIFSKKSAQTYFQPFRRNSTLNDFIAFVILFSIKITVNQRNYWRQIESDNIIVNLYRVFQTRRPRLIIGKPFMKTKISNTDLKRDQLRSIQCKKYFDLEFLKYE